MRRPFGSLFVAGGLAILPALVMAQAPAPAPPRPTPAAGEAGTPPLPNTTDLSLPAAERRFGGGEPTGAAAAVEAPPTPAPTTPPAESPAPESPAKPEAPAEPPAPTYTITLGPRHACATPMTHGVARADGGLITVATPSSNELTALMTAGVAADLFLGCTSTVTETLTLSQDFTIECSDPKTPMVQLKLNASLAGVVRSKSKAYACMRLAQATIAPVGWTSTPLQVAFPPMCVEGTDARICNQQLPPICLPMPVGCYRLVATFVLDATAGGLCDGHAQADFAPGTALPWVRMRDPFQTGAKDPFGFQVTLTAEPPKNPPHLARAEARRPEVQQVRYEPRSR